VVERTFGTEELSIRSPILEGLEPPPVLTVHSRDAGRLGLAPEDRVILDLDGGALEVGVEIREDMAPGVIILPRHRRLPWQRAGKNGVRLPWDKIRRAGP
jgi:NADH-quinone oxidoreductase subunit G